MSVRGVIAAVALSAVAAWLVVGMPLPDWWDSPEDVVSNVARDSAPAPVLPQDAPRPAPVEPAPAPLAPGEMVDVLVVPNAGAPRASPPVATPTRRSGPKVDESALRFFARQGDLQRLQAEIARLRALYPGWQPPADPAAPEVFTDPELDRMWAMLGEGDYAAVRAAIAERREVEPDWTPPAALTDLLDQADARIRIVNASDAKQWRTVLDAAAAAPALLTCANVDVLWRVAEAFAETDRPGRAKDAYVYILTNCEDPPERAATIVKAMETLPEADALSLFALERGDEFQAARDILIRRRVGVLAENPDADAEEDDLKRIEELAVDDGNAADALLLGWYYYRHKEPARALDWFAKARTRDPSSAKAAEGYALSLIDLRRFAEAEAAGYDWNEKATENLAAYLIAAVGLLATDPPVKISEPVLERIVAVTLRERSLKAGEQLGWYAYNLGQVRTAVRWFETVRKWNPDYEPAAYGLAVARWALKDREAVNALIREWGDRSERIANIGKPVRADLRGSAVPVIDVVVDRRATDDFEDEDYGAPLAYAEVDVPAAPVRTRAASPPASGGARSAAGRCAGGPPVTTLSPESALTRAWCLMDINRPAEAAIAFDTALLSTNPKTREDAAYGASLARIRTGVTSQASVTAAAAPQSPKRQVELNASILAQQATAAFADGRYLETILALDERLRYAPEQTDLLMLRGFAYFKFGRYPEAKRIFEAVARTGVPEAIDGLAAVQAAQSGINR